MSALTLKTTLAYVEDELYEGSNAAGNKVRIDMRPAGQKQSQAPMEMLLSAITACAAVDIVSMLKKKRKTVVDLQASAEGQRRDEYPAGFTAISMHFTVFSPDASADDVDKVVKLAVDKYCSVSYSLANEVAVSYTSSVEVVPGGAPTE